MMAGGNVALPRRAEGMSQYQSLIPKGRLALMLSVGEAGSLAHKNNLSPTPLDRQIGFGAPWP